MKEYCRLGNLGFLQLIVGSGEHDISNLEAENLVGLIKKFFCQCVVIVEILTHTYELRTLSRENKCFHFILLFFKFIINIPAIYMNSLNPTAKVQ